jgi:hypothetical protein
MKSKKITTNINKIVKNAGRKPFENRNEVKEKRISFLITESNYNLLHNIAKMEKTTLSAIITNALEEKMKFYINKNQNKLEFELNQK